jgi:anti-sigma-K factor RskA
MMAQQIDISRCGHCKNNRILNCLDWRTSTSDPHSSSDEPQPSSFFWTVAGAATSAAAVAVTQTASKANLNDEYGPLSISLDSVDCGLDFRINLDLEAGKIEIKVLRRLACVTATLGLSWVRPGPDGLLSLSSSVPSSSFTASV